jgi:hypothetical protein
MKINRLETHDRLQHFVKDQSANIFQGAEDCLKKNPYSLAIQEKSPYIYLFAHPRTDEDGTTKRMLWQPRLSIPSPQTNSYLFRAISKTDLIEVIWIIPPRELWDMYEKGKITENADIAWFINQFQFNRKKLKEPHPDDMPEEKSRIILRAVIFEKIQQSKAKQVNAVVSSEPLES